MTQNQQDGVESMETLRPMDNAAREQQEAQEAQEQGSETQEDERSPEERLAEEIAEKERERDDEMRETIAVEEKVFSDEHESIKTIDRAFEKLGTSIPFPSNMDQDKTNLKGSFKELKVALKDIGELSVSAKREVDREGGVGMGVHEITRLKKDACEKAREIIEAMRDNVKEFVSKVKTSLKEHASNTGEDMTDETAEMIKMEAMFEDVFRNTEFVANRWDETGRKNEELDDLKDGAGDGAEDIVREDAEEGLDRENVGTRLAEGQDASTKGVAANQEISDAAAAATENTD